MKRKVLYFEIEWKNERLNNGDEGKDEMNAYNVMYRLPLNVQNCR